jgi:hypothetical protein
LIWRPHGRTDGVCIDVSQFGARVSFSYKFIVPGQFTIICARLGLNRDCDIVRQDGCDTAVRFRP